MNDLINPPLIKINSIHANGIKMVCEWICKRCYDIEFNEKTSKDLNFTYLFGVDYDKLVNKYTNSNEFLKLFDFKKTGYSSIPAKCLAFFSKNNKYDIFNSVRVHYHIIDRFWKSLGRDILDCFLKRQVLENATEWLNNGMIDSFGSAFKLTVWSTVLKNNKYLFKYDEWTHIEKQIISFNDNLLEEISEIEFINILLKIIGPLKIGISLYAVGGINYLNDYNADKDEDLDWLIILFSYSYFPIYYIRAGPSNMFTDEKIINKDFQLGYSTIPFGVELCYIDTFLKLCPSSIIISVVNTSIANADTGVIDGYHWVMLSFNRVNDYSNECALICSMGCGFNRLDDKFLVPEIRKLKFNMRYNNEQIQRDGHSCGVYSILAMMYYSINRNIQNTVKDIKELKRRVLDNTNSHEDMIKIIIKLIGVRNNEYSTSLNNLETEYKLKVRNRIQNPQNKSQNRPPINPQNKSQNRPPINPQNKSQNRHKINHKIDHQLIHKINHKIDHQLIHKINHYLNKNKL